MNEPLDEQYLYWLYGQISSVKLRQASRTYWSLIRQLYTKEFVWFIPNDDNRVEDGRELRYEFLDTHDISYSNQDWMHLGCSMLEMIIAMSRRLAFETEGEPAYWFWLMLENLRIESYNDRTYDNRAMEDIDEALDMVIWRTYNKSGHGGLFPLHHSVKDQRKVEIWYQKSAYILEHD